MGLDSVELIMDWEEFFEIEIPDIVAEKIETVHDAVEYISNHVNYHDRGINIKAQCFEKLTAIVLKLNLINRNLEMDDLIIDIIPPTNSTAWIEIAEQMKCSELSPFGTNKFEDFVIKILPVEASFQNSTVDRFTDLICAINFNEILEKGKIQDEYEVLIGVIGMTIDKIGINPYDVLLSSSFVNDLRID